MKYAAIRDNKFTGVIYDELTQAIQAWADSTDGISLIPVQSEAYIYDEKGELKTCTLEDKKTALLQKLNSDFAVISSTFSSDYPLAEQQTWAAQAKEAQEVLQNEKANAPILTAIASARGISVKDLVALVCERVDNFNFIASLIGARQKMRDLIYEAKTEDELNLIENKLKKGLEKCF